MKLRITQELFDQYRDGNREVGDMIIDLTYNHTKNYLYKMTKSNADAEEITQEIFAVFWERREKLMSREAFYSYLFRIIKSKLSDYYKNKSKEIVVAFSHHIYTLKDPNGFTQDFVQDSEHDFIKLEEDLIMEKNILRLSEQKRKAFTMHKIDGMSVKEISKRMGLSERTVERHIYLAVKELRNTLVTVTALLFSAIFL